MNVTDFQEIWQIEVGGQIYEANFEVMAQWIWEGSLLPQDMVKRGNLRWIEARKVPALMQFFNAKEQGLTPPVFASMTDGQQVSEVTAAQPQNFAPPQSDLLNPYQTNIVPQAEDIDQPPPSPFGAPQTPQSSFGTPQTPQNPFGAANFQPQNNWQEQNFSQPTEIQTAVTFNQPPSADVCSMHPNEPASFVCETCGNGFCKVCPKSYGGTVKICPFCGAMCKPLGEAKKQRQQAIQYTKDLSKGFGFEDFFNALAYPFKFKTSLFFGALMFMFFTLGQGAASMGMSVFLIGAALMCFMFANMLTYGVLANTVENFSQGRIGGNFMPSFDDFSIWDDVLQPFFLSLATYIVSFGLFIGLLAYLIYAAFAAVQTKTPTFEDRIMASQKEMEKRYGDTRFKDEPDQQKVEELQKMIQEQRKKDLETVVGKTPETQQEDNKKIVEQIFGTGGWMIWLLLGTLLWGIFYYPAACAVAGYTRSFGATLNPFVGIDTIKILGLDYIKILVMCFILGALIFAVNKILSIAFSAFDMPTVGNIPAKIIGSLFNFYIAVVFAVIIGFALYKNSDKLRLFKG